MKISDLGEFGLIGRIQKLVVRKSLSTLVGIGDDAAVVRLAPAHALLATSDLLIEHVHFDLSYYDFYSLGWKSAAVNLSDIAAMGGVPRFCMTALAIPARVSVEHLSEFYRGFNAVLRKHASELIGGDTCSSRKGLFISVTALGEVEPSRLVTRGGAKPGDRVFVTGTLGDAAAGLELLKSRATAKRKGIAGQGPKANRLVLKHLRPDPRVEWGRKLALSGCASAMIDVSDGVSSELSHICEQSRVGAQIYTDQIPLSPALRNMSGKLTRPLLQYALSGGEDYELLFTAPPAKLKKLHSLRLPLTEIGLITPGKAIFQMDAQGRKMPLRASGYDHFRGDRPRRVRERHR